MNKRALVIFSGGQDSTTCLGWAKQRFEHVEAITFLYGQKHTIEGVQAQKICELMGIPQHVFCIDMFKQIGDSNLVNNGDVSQHHSRIKELPASFVPNRNMMFITIAHALAQKLECDNLVTGVCETDYSGYPDCRAEFIKAVEIAANLGSLSNIMIHTPLMHLTKKQTFDMAHLCGIIELVIEHSHTCYNGNREIRHEWGYGCGECPACKLREKGFKEFKEAING